MSSTAESAALLACGPLPAMLADAGPVAFLVLRHVSVVLALQSGPIIDSDPPLGIDVLSAFFIQI